MLLACVLVDARHDPMEIDMAMIEELEFAGRPFAVLLTKTDKLKPRQVESRLGQFKELLGQCRKLIDVIPTSAVTGDGRSHVIGMMKRVRTISKEAAS
jgi:GTP-binding protein